jgi:hypothetical protein
MLGAQCITNPCALMSCATAASGILVDTKITVPARLLVCMAFDISLIPSYVVRSSISRKPP